MCPLRRVEDSRAGASALGILAPPGPCTFLILRPRSLPWDLLLLRDDAAAFAELSREQAQASAYCLLHALEDGPEGADPFEAAFLPDGGCWLRVRIRSYRFVLCRRAPGQHYQPARFGDAAGAETAAEQLARLLFPAAGAEQEIYLNAHHFTRLAAMPYTPILATLGYVLSPDRSRVLLVHRCRRPGDAHLGKYNGLGGKLEPNEDVATCMRREIREESGLECEELLLRGTISWPGFGKQGEDWFGFIFRIDRWSGQPWTGNAEGPLEWIEIGRVLELPLWEGDRFFLPLVFEESRQFHGVMPYRDGRPVSWSYSIL